MAKYLKAPNSSFDVLGIEVIILLKLLKKLFFFIATVSKFNAGC